MIGILLSQYLHDRIVLIDECYMNVMGQINVPVKTCTNCGEVFVIGYHASVGVQFWITVLTVVGGVVYWAVRGRSERCPKCKGKNYQTFLKTLEV